MYTLVVTLLETQTSQVTCLALVPLVDPMLQNKLAQPQDKGDKKKKKKNKVKKNSDKNQDQKKACDGKGVKKHVSRWGLQGRARVAVPPVAAEASSDIPSAAPPAPPAPVPVAPPQAPLKASVPDGVPVTESVPRAVKARQWPVAPHELVATVLGKPTPTAPKIRVPTAYQQFVAERLRDSSWMPELNQSHARMRAAALEWRARKPHTHISYETVGSFGCSKCRHNARGCGACNPDRRACKPQG